MLSYFVNAITVAKDMVKTPTICVHHSLKRKKKQGMIFTPSKPVNFLESHVTPQ